MPEGHLIHRFAREQHAELAGHVLRVSSPQGRFDARPYEGRVLKSVEAVGKHLLYHVDGAPPLHVHLGIQGVFLRYDDPAAPPREGTRMRLATKDVAYDLIAPIHCEPMDQEALAALRASLGPDPLHPDADREAAARRLAATRAPVGTALLNQSVWAGVGNAWRAELLFLVGLDPQARDIGVAAARRLWDAAVHYMALGRDAGKVVSDPTEPGRWWVYKRRSCRRCGAPVRVWRLGSRTMYACPVDQRGGRSAHDAA